MMYKKSQRCSQEQQAFTDCLIEKKFPPTSIKKYISGIPALNVMNPESTGDWHSFDNLIMLDDTKDYYIFGEGCKNNTNDLLGTIGIIDGTERLRDRGIICKNNPVYIAEHHRACFDLLYTTTLNNGIIDNIILDDWFPSIQDKLWFYELLAKAYPKITGQKRKILDKWIMKNPITV